MIQQLLTLGIKTDDVLLCKLCSYKLEMFGGKLAILDS